jgi:hypothetical protein
MVGLNVWWVYMKAIAEEFLHANMSRFMSMLSWLVRYCAMPPKLSSWKEKDIAQRGVKRMAIGDSCKATIIPPIKNDILDIRRVVAISWKNDSYLRNRVIWQLVATPISVFIKAKSDAALLFCWHVCGQFKSLFVKRNGRMEGKQHALRPLFS